MGTPVASLKATLLHGVAEQGRNVGFSATAGFAPTPPLPVDLGETLVADPALPSGTHATRTLGGRHTTVLPRRKGAAGAEPAEVRARFDHVRVLGEGGMGHVELARDNDIRRTVAVKRLHAEVQSEETLLRFADEVRIVGQLEHPAIVPVYDVGRDDSGQVFLVMKHISGETMEQIIDKLRAKDPAYTSQYSIEHRMHIFLGVLDAIRYAHARGVIHRDLKPANIMIGPYGEVTVLDWGIAKTIRREVAPGTVEPLERTFVDTSDKKLQETQLGSLAGTPLYMSPEQAAGRNAELDERSDVFSLAVVLLEWLSLEHPLSDKTTVTEVLAAIISDPAYVRAAANRALLGGVSAGWIRILTKAMARDPNERFQSVEAFETRLRDTLDGRVQIGCHVTFARRSAYEVLGWIDRHPILYLTLFALTAIGLLTALGLGGYRLVHGS